VRGYVLGQVPDQFPEHPDEEPRLIDPAIDLGKEQKPLRARARASPSGRHRNQTNEDRCIGGCSGH
jgi:hypothetical protein